MSAVGEADYLRHTREGYDATAVSYAVRFHGHLDDKPVDRAMLNAFAALVGAGHRIADVGCGTGATSAMLSRQGCDVIGIDLSPGMIAEARGRNPNLDFRIGTMTALDLDDDSFDGVCAWYSVIHVPDEELPRVFSEFHRVLRTGGYLLLAFQVGQRPRRLDEAFGRRVELTFHRRLPAEVSEALDRCGFTRYAQLLREPDDDGLESTPQAFLIVRKRTAA